MNDHCVIERDLKPVITIFSLFVLLLLSSAIFLLMLNSNNKHAEPRVVPMKTVVLQTTPNESAVVIIENDALKNNILINTSVIPSPATANLVTENKFKRKKQPTPVENLKMPEENQNLRFDINLSKINFNNEFVPKEVAPDVKNMEVISSASLGISKINQTSVSLKNGGTIKIGENFPSGEKLLSLDPENGQIVTNKRTILVL